MSNAERYKHNRRSATRYARAVVATQIRLAVVALLASTDCARVRKATRAALQLSSRNAGRLASVLGSLSESGRFRIRPALSAQIGTDDTEELRDAITVAMDLCESAVEQRHLRIKRGNMANLPGIPAWRKVALQRRASE